MIRPLYIAVICLVFLLILPLIAWHVLMPEEFIFDRLTDLSEQGNIKVNFEGFRKGLLFSIHADRVVLLYKDASPLLTCEKFNASLNLLSLIHLSPTIDLKARSKDGVIKGIASLTGDRAFNLNGENLRLSDMEGLSNFGIKGDGRLDFVFVYSNGIGSFRFDLRDAKLQPFVSKSVAIPLDPFTTVKGMAEFTATSIKPISVSLQGKAINAVVKGSITTGRPDLYLEVMVHEGFERLNLLDLMIGRYRIAPGFYRVPVVF